MARPQKIHELLVKHFDPAPVSDLAIAERRFPRRVRADLQRALDALLSSDKLLLFSAVRKQHAHQGINFAELVIPDRHDPALAVPPQYEEVDVGDSEPVRYLKDGLWLMEDDNARYVVFLEPEPQYRYSSKIRFQVATTNDTAGLAKASQLFARLEEAVEESSCYRGKILSLEQHEDYRGVSAGLRVHKLKSVPRNQVILPQMTLELLERNVLRFVEQRGQLAERGLATKKGVLFYGPPGTGKTPTIHYLAGELKGHTTLLMSAEQVGLLQEYMTLARLLQPSIVVMEDVDLIARDRENMDSVCEKVLLNQLLNEMDGLRPDANILFILTTNRPETLEAALASRPGRMIKQLSSRRRISTVAKSCYDFTHTTLRYPTTCCREPRKRRTVSVRRLSRS